MLNVRNVLKPNWFDVSKAGGLEETGLMCQIMTLIAHL